MSVKACLMSVRVWVGKTAQASYAAITVHGWIWIRCLCISVVGSIVVRTGICETENVHEGQHGGQIILAVRRAGFDLL
jgi:hypothetical protein